MAGVQLMLILVAIVMALLGLWQMVNPRGNWRATEGWKYRDPDANEPSETSYGLRRIGGFFRWSGGVEIRELSRCYVFRSLR